MNVRDGLRRLVAVGAVVLLALVGATTAQAAPPGGSWSNGSGLSYGNNGWAGQMTDSVTGERWFCALDSQLRPTQQPGVFSEPVAVQAGYRAEAQAVNGIITTTLTAAEVQAIGYVMATWGASSSANEAAAAYTANHMIARTFAASPNGGSAIYWAANGGGSGPMPAAIRTRAEQMVTEANANRGPYTAGVPDVSVASGGAGSAANLGVLNGANGRISGYSWTATLHTSDGAAATWDSTGTTTLTGTTGSPQSAAFTATSGGYVEVRIAISGVPGPLMVSASPTAQDLFLAGSTQTVRAADDPVAVQVDFLPSISSQVRSFPVNEGDRFRDTVTIGVTDGDWPRNPATDSFFGYTVVSTLYGFEDVPPAQASTVPADATVLDTITWTANGPGDYDVDSTFVAPPGSGGGFAAWTTAILRENQPQQLASLLREDVIDGYFIPSETHVVRVDPTVVTEVDDRFVSAGDPAIDHLTLSLGEGQSWPRDRDGNVVEIPVTATLYKLGGNYPIAEQDTIPDSATLIGSETLTFTEEGTLATSGETTFPSEGIYTWVTSIPRTDFHNGEYNGEATRFGIISETASARYEITHFSQTREYNVHAGGRAFDAITIGGIPAWHGDFEGLGEFPADGTEATVRVYGPVAEAPSGSEVPEGIPVLWEDTVEFRNGTVQVGYDDANPIIPTEPGHYVFVYSFAGDSVIAPFTSDFDDVLERFFVPDTAEPGPTPPQVITRAVPVVVAGVPATDEAIVTGTVPEGSQLTFDYFLTQREDNDAECVVPSAEEIERLLAEGPAGTLGPIDVTGPAVYTSPEIDTTDLGGSCIWWVEQLTGPDGEVLDEGAIGTPGETTRVVERERDITVTTKAKFDHDVPRVGEEIWDTVLVEGEIVDGDYVVVDLYTWQTGGEPVCESPVWSSEPIELVPGTTEYETGTYVTLDAAEHGFVESTYSARGELLSRGECGEPDETVTVDEPTVRTQLIARDADGEPTDAPVVGDEIADTVIVDGPIREGDYTIVELYVAQDDVPLCEGDNKVWESDRIELIPGTTGYVTEWWTTENAGIHYFVETTYDTDGNVLSRGVCGDPDETITVTARDDSSGSAGLAETGVNGLGVLAGIAGALTLGGIGLAAMRTRGRHTA